MHPAIGRGRRLRTVHLIASFGHRGWDDKPDAVDGILARAPAAAHGPRPQTDAIG